MKLFLAPISVLCLAAVLITGSGAQDVPCPDSELPGFFDFARGRKFVGIVDQSSSGMRLPLNSSASFLALLLFYLQMKESQEDL